MNAALNLREIRSLLVELDGWDAETVRYKYATEPASIDPESPDFIYENAVADGHWAYLIAGNLYTMRLFH